MSKCIILIGYRGSGKTTIATELSNKLGFPIISIDEEIKKRIGSINESVEKHGWKQFRETESKVIQELNAENAIIDCGGGVVEDEKNIENLRKKGMVVWLRADSDTIIKRLEDSHERPSITGNKSFIDEVGEVLTARIPLYKKACNFEIDTSNKTPKQVSDEMLELLE
ncbi:shikimate kinase [Candidatus Woesearchaeota archaeon]|nr:shikimate kinase [Candidatus Woesearchaeota archaeon]|tara:strand:- start:1760 stop:2263 length:504 start_codon:yes stop_codon:yes gene_type:complete